MTLPGRPRYRPQADDTDPEIDRRLVQAYRVMTPTQKAARIAGDSLAVQQLALAGIAVRHPEASPDERFEHLASRRLGREVLSRILGTRRPGWRVRPMEFTDPVALALRVVALFEGVGITCVVGGSLASSVFGEPRSTEDVDIVTALGAEQVPPLLEALGADFYVDGRAVRRAVEHRSSFNIIHLPSARKVDIFVPPRTPFFQQQLERRRLVSVSEDPPAQLWLLTPEDAVLQKLEWYRKSGEVSDRQWRDVLGLVKVQGDELDWGYLRTMADSAGLRELLERARAEAGKEDLLA